MSQPQIEIIIIGTLIAISCSIVGVFLVLRKLSMMSDAITHTVLLGIVIGYFMTHDMNSPVLMIGAVVMGLITVYMVEMLQNTRLLSEEASIGVVFPFIFSIAVILISRYAGSVHLDTDAVLLGELAFAPLSRLSFLGISIPTAYLNAGFILILDAVIVTLFFKELKVTSFDPILAAAIGISPVLMNYLLMTLVSITAVGAFNAVGSILVIAFMIGPPVTAYLMTHDLKRMIYLSVLISAINVFVGYQIARILDVSIAGSMAVMTGISFVLVFLFEPNNGYVMRMMLRSKQKRSFKEMVVLLHIYNHHVYHQDIITEESVKQILNYDNVYIENTLQLFAKNAYIEMKQDVIILTQKGVAVSRDYEKTMLSH